MHYYYVEKSIAYKLEEANQTQRNAEFARDARAFAKRLKRGDPRLRTPIVAAPTRLLAALFRQNA